MDQMVNDDNTWNDGTRPRVSTMQTTEKMPIHDKSMRFHLEQWTITTTSEMINSLDSRLSTSNLTVRRTRHSYNQIQQQHSFIIFFFVCCCCCCCCCLPSISHHYAWVMSKYTINIVLSAATPCAHIVCYAVGSTICRQRRKQLWEFRISFLFCFRFIELMNER